MCRVGREPILLKEFLIFQSRLSAIIWSHLNTNYLLSTKSNDKMSRHLESNLFSKLSISICHATNILALFNSFILNHLHSIALNSLALPQAHTTHFAPLLHRWAPTPYKQHHAFVFDLSLITLAVNLPAPTYTPCGDSHLSRLTPTMPS